MATKQITQNKLAALKNALYEEVLIAKEAAKLAERKEKNRALLLELGQPFVDTKSRTVCPGFKINQNTEVEIEDELALNFAKSEGVFAAAAPLLKIHKDCVGMIIGFSMQVVDALTALSTLPETPETNKLRNILNAINFQNVFELDAAGYKKAVRERRFNGMPVTSIVEKETVAITIDDLKIGDDLNKHFEIVEHETIPAGD